MKIVIKIGGSVSIGRDGPNFSYFNKLLPVLEQLKKRNQVILAIGGGQITRIYGKSVEKFAISNREKELIYLELIKANVRFLASMLKMRPIFTLDEIKPNTRGVIGGIAPGRSTDANAAIAAARIRADIFIKLTNVNGVYDKDPNKFRSAKKFDKISFAGMKKLAVKGRPNKYGVLDKLAIKALSSAKIKTVVVNGKDPENITRVLHGENLGTTVR